jgi:hypothetical protein
MEKSEINNLTFSAVPVGGDPKQGFLLLGCYPIKEEGNNCIKYVWYP